MHLFAQNNITSSPYSLYGIGDPLSLNNTMGFAMGDVKYGKTEFLPNTCIALLAHSLSIEHPIKKEPLTITAPIPQEEPWTLFDV